MNKLLFVSLLASLALALFSWVASAFGVPVNNLLCEEGLRWLLMQGVNVTNVPYLGTLVLCCMVLGTLPERTDRVGWCRLLIYLLVFWTLFTLLLLVPSDTLRGINGSLYPSPFCSAAPTLFCLSVMAIRWHMTRQSPFFLLTNGLRQYAGLPVVYLLLFFLYNELMYICR